MYTPSQFKNDNSAEVREFLHKNSFGILVSRTDSKLCATHIPLELDKNEEGKEILTGHISRANPQWKNFVHDSEVLAIFPGPHSYVSSSWYGHENVPTWNYIAVHIYGKIKIIEGEKLLNALKKLVHKYEQASENPVSVETMNPQFVTKEMKGIVGFEIEIAEIQSAYKLSQNRNAADHNNITHELEKKGDEHSKAIAKEMKTRKVGNS